jgi:hypothetical protein
MDINRIPKIIWCYWDNKENNKNDSRINLFLKNWIKYTKKSYKITLINRNTINLYIKENIPYNFHKLLSAHQADWIRLNILKIHGGIWMDMSTILTKNLDEVLNKQLKNTNGILFYIDKFSNNYNVIENWFIACSKNNFFINAWCNEFNKAIKMNDYNEYLKLSYPIYYKSLIQNIDKHLLKYLTMHLCAQKVIQIDRVCLNFTLLKAEDGPFYLDFLANWDVNKTVSLITNKTNLNYIPPIIKLIKPNRELLFIMINNDKIKLDSIAYTYLLN